MSKYEQVLKLGLDAISKCHARSKCEWAEVGTHSWRRLSSCQHLLGKHITVTTCRYICGGNGSHSITFSQAINMEDAYAVLCQIRSVNKVFRRSCSQVILLNHKIEAAKKRYDRARSVRRLSFRYSNRLKLTSLEGVRNLIYEHACAKCEEIEALQSKLRQLTGGVYDFTESDSSESEEHFSD